MSDETALESTGDLAPAHDAAAVPPTGMRYRPVRFHAKGGLGEVWVAEDEKLHREVALKRIQPRFHDDADSRQRFQVEAEITARLQHPGIVPVMDLVEDETGQPCYAMRFVEGESLKDAIRRFHEADARPGRDPGERTLALRGLLGRFVAVCNTVAYAHSRGVLHRDLKPANILLGKYGETLVADWGLAKPFGRTEAERSTGEETLQPTADSPESTRLGEARGTPSYMSPEQAAGRWDVIGPASDLYGLGATLYHLLTGQAPYRGSNHAEVLQKVQQGNCPPPRQLKPEVPRPLEAICMKAMARRPEDRYATALRLAEDVEHWLADEPVAAYREPLWDRLRRWGRRRKPLVAGLAALLLTAVVLGGGFGVWRQQQRTVTAVAVGEFLDQGERLRDEDHPLEARQALERAEARLAAGGPAELGERLRQLRRQLDTVDRLEQARLQQSIWVEEKFNYAGADRAYREAFAEEGLDLSGPDGAATAEQIGRSPLRKQLVVALDDWAYVKDVLRRGDGEALRAVARRADDDPWRQQLRDPAVRRDLAALRRLAEQADKANQPPANLVLLSRLLQQRKDSDTAEKLLWQAQQRYLTDFWINFELGTFLARKKPPNREGAIGFYRAALALRPQNAAVHNNLGTLLKDTQRPAEAEAAFRKAIDIQPDHALAWNNLGTLLKDTQRPAEAEAAFRKAIEVQPDHALAWSNLGILLAEQKQLVEAEAAYRKAIEVQPDHANAWNNLGLLLKGQKQLAEAEAAYRKAIALQPDYAMAWNNLGLLLKEQKRPAEAEAAYRKALALQPDYANAWNSLGNLLRDQKKVAEAEAAYRKAIALQPDHALAWNNLGLLLKDQNKPTEAEAAYCKAIALQPGYAQAHCNLGLLFWAQGRFTEALASLQRGHELGSRNPAWRYPSAGWVRQAERLVELDGKLPALLKGEAKPAGAAEQIELARLCRQYKQFHAASARFYRDAFAAEPKLADDPRTDHRYNAACAAALAGCGQGKDADTLDEPKRADLRQQALTWLRDELKKWTALREKEPDKAGAAVQQRMQHWQTDADLAGVRDADALARLPEDERKQWQQLWQEVETLRKRAAEPK